MIRNNTSQGPTKPFQLKTRPLNYIFVGFFILLVVIVVVAAINISNNHKASAAAAPTIASVTAFDSSCGDSVLGDSDTLTMIFDMSTNAPTVNARVDVDGLLDFGLFTLGTNYSGAWSTTNNVNDTLTISILNGKNGNMPIGSPVTIIADGTNDLKDITGTSPASVSSGTLAGNWGDGFYISDGAIPSGIYDLSKTLGSMVSRGLSNVTTFGIARRASDGLLFVAERGAGNNTLNTFNPITGVNTLVGSIGNGITNLVQLAFNGQGTLYGMNNTHDLYQLNTTTGAPTLLCNANVVGAGGDFAFDASGTLYAMTYDATNSYLYTLDPTQVSCAPTLIGTNTVINLAGLSFDSSNNLFASSYGASNALYSINKVNGAATFVNNLTPTNTFYDLTNCAAHIPQLGSSTKIDDDVDNVVVPGQTVTYTIDLTNTGATATGISMTDIVDTNYGAPYNYTYSNCGTPGANFVAPNLSFSNVDISTASTCQVTYQVDVDTPITAALPESEIIVDATTVSPSSGISNPLTADILAIDVTPDFSSSTLTAAASIYQPGDTVSYTATIINSGDGTGTGVDVNSPIDLNTQNITNIVVSNCGSSYVDSSSSTNLILSNLSIDVGTNCVITFDVDVKAGLADGDLINQSIVVPAADEGGLGANLSSGALTVFIPSLSLTIPVQPGGTTSAGSVLTYQYKVHNDSSVSMITGITVDDPFDSHLDNLTVASLTGCGVAVDNSVANPPTLALTNVSIAAGGDCLIDLSVSVKNTVNNGDLIDHTVTSGAPLEGGVGAAIAANQLTVVGAPVLSASLKDDDTDNLVRPGESVSYILTISNTGGQATGVNATENLDTNMENLLVQSISGCGSNYIDGSTGDILSISDLEIINSQDCVIVFSGDVKNSAPDGSIIPGQAKIGTPNEGGTIDDNMPAADNLKVSINTQPQPEFPIDRLGGVDRIATNIEIISDMYPTNKSVSAFCITRDDLFPDSLTIAPLCRAVDAPLFVTKTNNLDDRVANEIARLYDGNNDQEIDLYIGGGLNAISSQVETQLQAIDSTLDIHRFNGIDRYQTSAQISELHRKERGNKAPAEIFVASGIDFPDAMVASAIASSTDVDPELMSVLITPPTSLHELANQYIRTNKEIINKVHIVGGTQAVSKKVSSTISNNGITVERHFGKDRHETSVIMAKDFFGNLNSFAVARGDIFVDALSGAVHAGLNNQPILLVQSNELPQSISDYFNNSGQPFVKGFVYGGISAVDDSVIKSIRAAIPPVTIVLNHSTEGVSRAPVTQINAAEKDKFSNSHINKNNYLLWLLTLLGVVSLVLFVVLGHRVIKKMRS